jgi:hypothetical protein
MFYSVFQTSGEENQVDPNEFKKLEWLFPDTTKNFNRLPLQYKVRLTKLFTFGCLDSFIFSGYFVDPIKRTIQDFMEVISSAHILLKSRCRWENI